MGWFCASCTRESDDLAPVEQDGRVYPMCPACREGSVKLFTFNGGRDVSRFRTHAGSPNGYMGDGNRRMGSSTKGGHGGRG